MLENGGKRKEYGGYIPTPTVLLTVGNFVWSLTGDHWSWLSRLSIEEQKPKGYDFQGQEQLRSTQRLLRLLENNFAPKGRI